MSDPGRRHLRAAFVGRRRFGRSRLGAARIALEFVAAIARLPRSHLRIRGKVDELYSSLYAGA